MVLNACKHTKFAFNGNAALMGILHDFPGKLDVILEREG